MSGHDQEEYEKKINLFWQAMFNHGFSRKPVFHNGGENPFVHAPAMAGSETHSSYRHTLGLIGDRLEIVIPGNIASDPRFSIDAALGETLENYKNNGDIRSYSLVRKEIPGDADTIEYHLFLPVEAYQKLAELGLERLISLSDGMSEDEKAAYKERLKAVGDPVNTLIPNMVRNSDLPNDIIDSLMHQASAMEFYEFAAALNNAKREKTIAGEVSDAARKSPPLDPAAEEDCFWRAILRQGFLEQRSEHKQGDKPFIGWNQPLIKDTNDRGETRIVPNRDVQLEAECSGITIPGSAAELNAVTKPLLPFLQAHLQLAGVGVKVYAATYGFRTDRAEAAPGVYHMFLSKPDNRALGLAMLRKLGDPQFAASALGYEYQDYSAKACKGDRELSDKISKIIALSQLKRSHITALIDEMKEDDHFEMMGILQAINHRDAAPPVEGHAGRIQRRSGGQGFGHGV